MVAAILKKDDGVLVNNRLRKTLPVVDEVTLLEQVPEGVMAAVEVAAPGQVVRILSNPLRDRHLLRAKPGRDPGHRPHRPRPDWQPFSGGAQDPAGGRAVAGDPGGQPLH